MENICVTFRYSGLLRSIFNPRFILNKILDSGVPIAKPADKILFYHLYVDGTIVLFNGNKCELKLLIKYVNRMTPAVKLMLENELSNISQYIFDLTRSKSNQIIAYPQHLPQTNNYVLHGSH